MEKREVLHDSSSVSETQDTEASVCLENPYVAAETFCYEQCKRDEEVLPFLGLVDEFDWTIDYPDERYRFFIHEGKVFHINCPTKVRGALSAQFFMLLKKLTGNKYRPCGSLTFKTANVLGGAVQRKEADKGCRLLDKIGFPFLQLEIGVNNEVWWMLFVQGALWLNQATDVKLCVLMRVRKSIRQDVPSKVIEVFMLERTIPSNKKLVKLALQDILTLEDLKAEGIDCDEIQKRLSEYKPSDQEIAAMPNEEIEEHFGQNGIKSFKIIQRFTIDLGVEEDWSQQLIIPMADIDGSEDIVIGFDFICKLLQNWL